MKEIPLEELFGEPLTDEQIQALDFGGHKEERAITELPSDFMIRNLGDIRILEEFSAFKFGSRQRLYRGHASKTFNLDSSLTRLFRETKCTTKDVAEAEKKAFDMFCDAVSKDLNNWLDHKLDKSDRDLFIMSIGRHLGLPCRLIDVTSSLRTAICFAIMDKQRLNEDGEVIRIILDENRIRERDISPFMVSSIAFAQEPFKADRLDELPAGEWNRFVQYGRFLYVSDEALMEEENVISKYAFHLERFTIPHEAKADLAKALEYKVFGIGV